MATTSETKVSVNINTPVNATFSHPDGSTVSVYVPNITGDSKSAIKKLLQDTIASL